MESVDNIRVNEEKALQATEEIAEMTEKTGEKVTDSDTTITHKLSKPFEWEGKTYKELKLDFENLIGQDMIDIEDEMAAVGQYALSPEISTSYLSKLAAKAAGVGSDLIEHLPIRDFGRVKNLSRDFLIRTGLAN